MRAEHLSFLLPFAGSLGAMQAITPGVVDGPVRMVGLASMLGTLTVLVYRLGVWRQEIDNVKHNVSAEVRGYREESVASFERLDRRLEAIDHMLTASSDHRVYVNRWQARTERRLERLEECHREDQGG